MTRPLADTVIVSAADSGYFPMLEGLLSSIVRHRELGAASLAVFDLGLEASQREQLVARGIRLLAPHDHLGVCVRDAPPIVPGVLVRPFLRDYLPEFACHLWIDADAWVQDWRAVARLRDGAMNSGLAIVHESEPTYELPLWQRLWLLKHSIMGFGIAAGTRLLLSPMANAGVFAVMRDAPHLEVWKRCYREAIERTGEAAPYDQFSLNHVIWVDKLETAVLDPANNWICNRALPYWDPAQQQLCAPRAPFEPIGIVHLAGHLKTGRVTLRTTHGERYRMRLGFDAALAT